MAAQWTVPGDPAKMRAAAAACGNLAAAVDEVRDRIGGLTLTGPGTWTGAAADRAAEHWQELQHDLETFAGNLRTTQEQLTKLAQTVDASRTKLKHIAEASAAVAVVGVLAAAFTIGLSAEGAAAEAAAAIVAADGVVATVVATGAAALSLIGAGLVAGTVLFGINAGATATVLAVLHAVQGTPWTGGDIANIAAGGALGAFASGLTGARLAALWARGGAGALLQGAGIGAAAGAGVGSLTPLLRNGIAGEHVDWQAVGYSAALNAAAGGLVGAGGGALAQGLFKLRAAAGRLAGTISGGAPTTGNSISTQLVAPGPAADAAAAAAGRADLEMANLSTALRQGSATEAQVEQATRAVEEATAAHATAAEGDAVSVTLTPNEADGTVAVSIKPTGTAAEALPATQPAEVTPQELTGLANEGNLTEAAHVTDTAATGGQQYLQGAATVIDQGNSLSSSLSNAGQVRLASDVNQLSTAMHGTAEGAATMGQAAEGATGALQDAAAQASTGAVPADPSGAVDTAALHDGGAQVGDQSAVQAAQARLEQDAAGQAGQLTPDQQSQLDAVTQQSAAVSGQAAGVQQAADAAAGVQPGDPAATGAQSAADQWKQALKLNPYGVITTIAPAPIIGFGLGELIDAPNPNPLVLPAVEPVDIDGATS